MSIDYNIKGHKISDELNDIHGMMNVESEWGQKAATDIVKAKRMEEYLRHFKRITNKQAENKSSSIQVAMEDAAIEVIAKQISQKIGDDSGLFNRFHNPNYSKAKEMGADDIFEIEFVETLNLALQQSYAGKQIDISSMEATVTGQELATVVLEPIGQVGQQSSIEAAKKSTKKTISNNLTDQIKTDLAKQGKIDAKGYNINWSVELESNIKPEWQEFIKLFNNATFSLKNYSSNSNQDSIHLGENKSYKGIVGPLISPPFSLYPDEAVHVYYHAQNSSDTMAVGIHIPHLRFYYELTGAGLSIQDESGSTLLSQVDFLIYNDPASDNIFVRSTKKMVLDYFERQEPSMSDPFNSNVVILKSSF